MPKPGFVPNNLKPWIEARKRFRLSHAQVQMARELGLNPKKLGGIANHDQERWKIPLPQYIEHLYEKRFKKKQPDDVRPLEERETEKRKKKAGGKAAKLKSQEQDTRQ
jgi:hypothetical protein